MLYKFYYKYVGTVRQRSAKQMITASLLIM